MTPITTLSAERSIKLYGFIWYWLRAVEPTTVDLYIFRGEVRARDAGGWKALGSAVGWLRLARALGALRDE